MIIALDLDGVCYHWDRTARYLLRRWYADRGFAPPENLYHDSRWWDHLECSVAPEAWRWLWSEGVQEGLFRHGHVVSGSIEGVQELSRLGHEVYVVTARPPQAVRDTLAWLTLHFHRVPLAGIRFLEQGASKSCVQAHIYIDDGPHVAADLVGRGLQVLLYDRPWNRLLDDEVEKSPLFYRVKSWQELTDVVKRRGVARVGA